MLFAYIALRPLLYLVCLPAFLGILFFVRWWRRSTVSKGRVLLLGSLLFTLLFGFLAYGPFVGQLQRKTYEMRWAVNSKAMQNGQTEVVFTFTKFPQYTIVRFSNKLAAHLRQSGKKSVPMEIELISDYGKTRGYQVKKIDGLKDWGRHGGYSGRQGNYKKGMSPWD